MSVAHAFSSARPANSRWLLLGSLALNLFFVGVAAAMAIRAPAPPARWDANVFVRVERLAANLPPADADILRGAIQTNHDAIDGTQTAYHRARDGIRATLREEPFKADAMRVAMVKTRAARQSFDQAIQGVFADAVVKMSPAGRHAIADWRSGNGSKRSRQ
jgi:uncharacterized membrane protein